MLKLKVKLFIHCFNFFKHLGFAFYFVSISLLPDEFARKKKMM